MLDDFFPFIKKLGFWGMLGPYCGIGATICIGSFIHKYPNVAHYPVFVNRTIILYYSVQQCHVEP